MLFHRTAQPYQLPSLDPSAPAAGRPAGPAAAAAPAGLFCYGWSMAMMVKAGLGLDPWDVLHQGLTRYLPFSFGTVTIIVGAIVLLLWIPLRQWPGLGTVANVFVIGLRRTSASGVLPDAGRAAGADRLAGRSGWC